MDRKAAKELLHIDGWLDRSAEIVGRVKDAYLASYMAAFGYSLSAHAVPRAEA